MMMMMMMIIIIIIITIIISKPTKQTADGPRRLLPGPSLPAT